MIRFNLSSHKLIDDIGGAWSEHQALTSDEWADFVVLDENGNEVLNKSKISIAGRIHPAYVEDNYDEDHTDMFEEEGYDYFAYGAHCNALDAMKKDTSLPYTRAYQLAYIDINDASNWSRVMGWTENETAVMLLKYK